MKTVKLALIAVLALPFNALAVDYRDAKITGVGLVHSEDHIRFTIDKDPNVILTTRQFTGEQHQRVVSLVLSAYAANSTIAFLRSSDQAQSGTKHYADALIIEAGAITHD